jgi:NAD(P)-dependent dehydrogenase (short-subunit alcohol dehydrogenase family)
MRAVIMGGSSGIGLATAQTLTRSGIEVTVTGRDETKLAAIRGSLAGAVQLDGTDRAAVAEFFAAYGAFEHLVLAFSPGAGAFGPIRELSMEAIETAFSGKLFAYLHAIREARVTESVTMVSAASARSAVPGTVALAAANGSIERAVSPLAAELAPVRVNAVSPGVIDTPWWAFLPEAQRRSQFDAIAAETPVARIGRAADVADAVNYIVHAGFVTATVLPVDGGSTVA